MYVTYQTPTKGEELPEFYSLYMTDYAKVAPFFQADPADPQVWAERAAAVTRRRGASRRQVSSALVKYNSAIGAHRQGVAGAEALAEPETLAVVTGQQAGLFTGPLFTIYKALSTVRLARKLAQELQVKVVPVFWVASEDHDFVEIRQAHLVDRRGNLRTLTLPGEGQGRSIGHLPVPRRLDSLLQEVADALGDYVKHPEMLAQVGQAAKQASSLADWFARVLAQWLSPYGLVIMDPMLPAMRELARDMYPTVLLRRDAISRELAAAEQRLRRHGFEPGLTLEPDHAFFCHYHEGRRLPLFWQDGQLTDREGRVRLTVAQVTQALRERPGDFSPNVVTRPLIQDHLLPTIAQVVGPGELLYLAQMREVYPLFGLQMPVLVPRLSLTLVQPEVAQALGRHNLGAAEVWRNPQESLAAHLDELDPVGIDEVIAGLAHKVKEAYGDALSSLNRAAPSLDGVGQETLRRVERQIDYLQAKAWQHHRRRHRQLNQDINMAANWLRPRGSLQERVLTGLPLVARYGPGFFRALLRAPEVPGHQFGLVRDDQAAAEFDFGL